MRLHEHPEVRDLLRRGVGLLFLLGIDAALTVYAARRDLHELEALGVEHAERPEEVEHAEPPTPPVPARRPCRPCQEAAAAGHEIRCRCSERLRLQHAGQQVEGIMAGLREPSPGPNTAALTANLQMFQDAAPEPQEGPRE